MDDFDRRILAELTFDASQSYSRLGETVGLSAAAVHERVRKLKANRTIKSNTISIDGPSVGKPFLAFVEVEFSGWGKTRRLKDLEACPEVEEMHSIAGDWGLLLKVRCADAHALECFLARLYELKGITRTKTTVVLSTFLERPVQSSVTSQWNVELMPDE